MIQNHLVIHKTVLEDKYANKYGIPMKKGLIVIAIRIVIIITKIFHLIIKMIEIIIILLIRMGRIIMGCKNNILNLNPKYPVLKRSSIILMLNLTIRRRLKNYNKINNCYKLKSP